MLTGSLLALVLYYPIYGMKLAVTNLSDPARFQLAADGVRPLGEPKVDSIAADPTKGIAGATVTLRKEVRTYADGTTDTVTTTDTLAAGATEPKQTVKHTVRFPSLTSPPAMTLTFLIFVQVFLVTMVYGPIAAFLVELFPTRIRYTSMSLPYHIGNGVFGGMVPFIGQLFYEKTKNPFAGLWFPMAICAMTLVVGMIFVRENRNVKMHEEH
jgi:hypothetical protein